MYASHCLFTSLLGVGVPNQGAGDNISVSNPFDDVAPSQSQRPNSYGPPYGHTGGPPRPQGTSLLVCLLTPIVHISCHFNCSHVHLWIVFNTLLIQWASVALFVLACVKYSHWLCVWERFCRSVWSVWSCPLSTCWFTSYCFCPYICLFCTLIKNNCVLRFVSIECPLQFSSVWLSFLVLLEPFHGVRAHLTKLFIPCL